MRYFIGYLITGEAAAWHRGLTKDISERFGTRPLHERIPPHITIYAPFDIDDVRGVRDFLADWASTRTVPGTFTFNAYDRYATHSVIARADTTQEVMLYIDELRHGIERVPGMPEIRHKNWEPHMTLAQKTTPEQNEDVWRYTQTLPSPDFIVPFDNVTLFRFEDRRWVIDESFPLQSAVVH